MATVRLYRNGKRNKYTGDFRIKVAEELINSGLSKHEVCSKYNLNESLVLISTLLLSITLLSFDCFLKIDVLSLSPK